VGIRLCADSPVELRLRQAEARLRGDERLAEHDLGLRKVDAGLQGQLFPVRALPQVRAVSTRYTLLNRESCLPDATKRPDGQLC